MKITNDDGTEYEVNAQGYVINPLFVVYKNSQKMLKTVLLAPSKFNTTLHQTGIYADVPAVI